MSEIVASTYEIIGKLGSGGGGDVYLANHLRLGKRVVLKVDKRNTNTRAVLLRREVDVLKELRHTYIPQVYDYFIENEKSYTVMDFVDGESLDKLLGQKKSFSQPQVIRWAKQLLMALSYLHSPTHGDPPRGYIHSDIKPANIMLRPNGDICLIDFNISLAMGMENIIGKSDGYSSPEYYAIDDSFSEHSYKSSSNTVQDDEETLIDDDDKTVVQSGVSELLMSTVNNTSQSSSVKKVIVPDARSDIYSVGATLYHLLSGEKPNRDAAAVVPLSCKKFSPLLVGIISKAMNPDPALRFHTADEMLLEFNNLWKNDFRVKRQKKRLLVGSVLLSAMFMAGGLTVFGGLKQMERLQAAQVLASNSSEALSVGDVQGAIDYALEALVDDPGMFDIPYTASAQMALTNAIGVYDMSDCFKPYSTIELSSAPFRILKSPDETKIAVCYAYELAIYDIKSGELIKKLPTLDSAFCEMEFLSDTQILYAGSSGLTAYDISLDTVLWQGDFATAIALSGDKNTAAAIHGTSQIINFYDTKSGEVISYRELDGKHLNVPQNDNFADSCRDVFELNYDGSMCAVSLSGGYLGVMDIYNIFNDLIIYDTSDYAVFDGAFSGDIFAFSAAGTSGSLFGIVNCATGQYIGDIQGNSIMNVVAYDGLYVSQNDTAVMFDTESFSQTEIAYTENKNISCLDISEKYVISATNDGYSIFSRNAGILQTEACETAPDFVLITDTYAVLADRNSPIIEILKFKDYGEACIINYDSRIEHSEARLLSDNSGVVLFSINNMTVVNADGSVRTAVELPESEKIYDQQYYHDGEYLEVTYYSGKVVCYSASTGKIISETVISPPDDSLDETFVTENFVIKSPLHGIPTVYDKATDRKIAELNADDYLTYITETDDYIIAQYVSAAGKVYGILMNKGCEPIAQIPYLCDICNGMLVCDFPAGNIKISPVYELDELKEQAENYRN